MTNNFSSLVVNDLDSVQFIGGDTQTFYFDVYDSAGSPVDLSATTCSVVISPYGQNNYAILTISGSVSGSSTNRFEIAISSSSTQTLIGKYTMQPVIIDSNGNEYRPSQGIVLITGRNATV
jgi:hypothetical protein